jgi:hypothetical protein
MLLLPRFEPPMSAGSDIRTTQRLPPPPLPRCGLLASRMPSPRCGATTRGGAAKAATTRVVSRSPLRRPVRGPSSLDERARDRRSTDPETGVASGLPEAAICVQDIDVQCVLQFTLIHAAGCALHRHTSRVIHRLELSRHFRYRRGEASVAVVRPGQGRAAGSTKATTKCTSNR